MISLREHVDRLHARQLVTAQREALDVTRPGRRVAADIRHALGAERGNLGGHAVGKARARRVYDESFDAFEVIQLAGCVAADDFDLDAVRIGVAAQIAHR